MFLGICFATDLPQHQFLKVFVFVAGTCKFSSSRAVIVCEKLLVSVSVSRCLFVLCSWQAGRERVTADGQGLGVARALSH